MQLSQDMQDLASLVASSMEVRPLALLLRQSMDRRISDLHRDFNSMMETLATRTTLVESRLKLVEPLVHLLSHFFPAIAYFLVLFRSVLHHRMHPRLMAGVRGYVSKLLLSAGLPETGILAARLLAADQRVPQPAAPRPRRLRPPCTPPQRPLRPRPSGPRVGQE
jgi:hypothetical protein